MLQIIKDLLFTVFVFFALSENASQLWGGGGWEGLLSLGTVPFCT